MPLPTSDFAYRHGFGDYEYGKRVSAIAGDATVKSGFSSSAGGWGGTQARALYGERRVEASGTILSATQQAHRADKDLFARHHRPGEVKRLFILGNRWLWAAVDGNITFEVSNYRRWKWKLDFVCADGCYYEEGAQSAAIDAVLTSGGGTQDTAISAVAVGGNAPATPVLTFDVDAIATPGVSYIRVANISAYLNGESQEFYFLPPAAGVYTVHMGPNCTNDAAVNRVNAHRALLVGTGTSVNKWRRDTGEVLLSPDAANTVRVQQVGLTLAADPTLTWLRRYI